MDEKTDELVNHDSWEIRALPEKALEAEYADVFCTAEPSSICGYIDLCRKVMRRKFPRSQARAFVWYLKEGPLVTFHRRRNKAHRGYGAIEIIGRYQILWQRQHYPDAYPLTDEMVKEWHGTHDDILDQLHIEFPF